MFGKIILIFFVSTALVHSVKSQKIKKHFIDSTDHALDVSGFLNTEAGFLPVPITITEPALGFGLGLGAVFFHKSKSTPSGKSKGQLPPIMTAAAGAYTSNGTWMVMLAHQGSYKMDRIRYTGALGYLSVNLEYYDRTITGDDSGLKFNMEGFLAFQELLFRPKKEIPAFIGLNYLYFTNEVQFEPILDYPELEEIQRKTNLGGINFVALWDSRNNSFTPYKGVHSALEIGGFSKYLGGDNDYWNFISRNYAYLPVISKRLFSGYRLNLESKWDDVPFYELPYIKLRGIPMMRYQNHNIAVVETEWRYRFFRRWSAVGFIGTGYAMKDYSDLINEKARIAGGGGLRYFIARDYGIHAGIDVAKGPEQWAWYLTIGSNWFR